MSPMPPDNILEMAGLLAPKSKAAAGMAVAPSPVRPPMAAPSEQRPAARVPVLAGRGL